MKRLLPVLLLPALMLAACTDWFEAPDPAGSATEPSSTIPVAEVSVFDALTYDGSVLGTWSLETMSRWRVRNGNTGEAVTVEETRRSDCCIYFQDNDGSTMVADFQAMEVQFGGTTLSIGGVVY